jgi:hypothetical protein
MSSTAPIAKDRLEVWLTDLSNSETGRICLVNMFLCLQQKLVHEDQFRAFIHSCLLSALPISNEDIFHTVCRQHDGKRVVFFGLAPINKSDMNANDLYSTTVTTSVFHHYLLAKSHQAAPYGLITRVLNYMPQTLEDEEEYADMLTLVTAKPDWAEPGASLGKSFPFPSHCWFTLKTSTSYPSVGTSLESLATKARDVLGLIHRNEGECLLEVSFTAEWLESLVGLILARPTFADCGNRRFAAVQTGPEYSANNSGAWGTTVNLAKLANQDRDVCGVPERVCSPIPIQPKTMNVLFLGKILGLRGLGAGIDDDAAFEARLRGSFTVREIIETLTKAVIN